MDLNYVWNYSLWTDWMCFYKMFIHTCFKNVANGYYISYHYQKYDIYLNITFNEMMINECDKYEKKHLSLCQIRVLIHFDLNYLHAVLFQLFKILWTPNIFNQIFVWSWQCLLLGEENFLRLIILIKFWGSSTYWK